MTTVERNLTLFVPADSVWTYLANPANLAGFVPTAQHVDTDVVDEADLADAPSAAATFLPDPATRTVEWEAPAAGFGLRVAVTASGSRMSELVLGLRADGDPEPAVIEALLDEVVANLRRALSPR